MANNVKELLQKLFRQRLVVAFIGLMAVLLIISGILSAFTTPPPPVQTVVSSDTVITPEMSFTGIDIILPPHLTVYSAQSLPNDIDKKATELANALQLIPHKAVRDVWISEQTDETLYFENNKQYIAYTTTQVSDPFTSLPKVTVQEATEKLLKFIQEHQLLQNAQLSSPQYIEISTEGFDLVENESEAQGYQFTILEKIDDIPYYSDILAEDLGIVWTDLSGKILKIRFAPISTNFNKIETYSSLSVENIKTNIKNGLVTYITVQPLVAQKNNFEQITNVEFKEADLEYRRNKNNGYILPYLRFSGLGTDDQGVEYLVEAISPAVRVE